MKDEKSVSCSSISFNVRQATIFFLFFKNFEILKSGETKKVNGLQISNAVLWTAVIQIKLFVTKNYAAGGPRKKCTADNVEEKKLIGECSLCIKGGL